MKLPYCKQTTSFKFSFKKTIVICSVLLFFSHSSKGQLVPITFHQYNPLKEKELTIGIHGSYFLGAESNYTITKNVSAFVSFNYDFMSYESKSFFGAAFKNYPNTTNFNIGLSYIKPLNFNSSNKLCFTFGIGRSSYKVVKFTSQNMKNSTTEASITPSFFELDYVIGRSRFEHYFTARLDVNYFHHYTQTPEDGGLDIVGKNITTCNVIAGYGLKYVIKNFKIGFQGGLGYPLKDLEIVNNTGNVTSSYTLTEYSPVFNLNLAYIFEINKTKNNSSKQ
jgi:hypothetical protein